MTLYAPAGDAVRLGDEIARGGEARIVHVPDRPHEVAKLYLRQGDDRSGKLRFMLSSVPHDPTLAIGHASIAWPRSVLLDRQRRLAGYLMPYIRGAVPLVEVYNPRRRAGVLPGFDERYLYRAARNLASALEALHARDYVVGDLNERNVLVTPRALVTLIDVDSFQVQESRDGRIVVYPCPVGRSEYTPPELQGQPFRDVVRRPEHDRFGLGVLVFQMLMGGSHPFRSVWRGAGDPPPVEERIARGWYPHGRTVAPEVAPPPARRVDTLPPTVAELLESCFVAGHGHPGARPTAGAWARGLAEAEKHLRSCPQGHFFGDHLRRCPVCSARPTRGSRGPARTVQPGPVPVGAAASGPAASGAAAAVGRRASGSPFAIPDALRAPGRAVRRAAAALPARVALVLLSPTRRQSAAATARAAGARAVWTARMALLAVLLIPSMAAGGAWIAAGLAARADVAALSLSGVALAGGLAGAVVSGAFQHLTGAPDRRLSAALLQTALARSLASGAGWLAGWWLAALALGVPLAVAGTLLAAPAPASLLAPVGLAAWAICWSAYGAVAGAVGASGRARPTSVAVAGGLFGAVAHVASRLAAMLLAGLGSP